MRQYGLLVSKSAGQSSSNAERRLAFGWRLEDLSLEASVLMVSYAQLNGMDTSKLTSAANAAEQLAKDLSDRAEELRCAAEPRASELWTGGDELAARTRIGEMPEPLYDGSGAFSRGQGGLEDLVDDIDAAKEHLEGAHDIAARSSIVISDDGTVSYPPAPQGLTPEDASAQQQHLASLARQARDIIDEALQMAVDADEAAVGRFETVTDGALESYFDAFPDAREDLERVEELLGMDPSRMETEEFEELNDLLAQYSDDPLVATELIERLGAQGLITVAGDFSFEGSVAANSDGSDQAGDRAEALEEFQRHLGETLATGTREGGLDEEFTQDLMNEGASYQEFDSMDNDQLGYLALAPLFEHGEYGEDFIVPVAEHMVRLDQAMGEEPWGEFPHEHTNPFVVADSGDPVNMGSGWEGAHPLNSAFVALDNNPDAAAAFFSGSEDYADMSYVGPEGEDLSGVDNNVTYLLDRAGDESSSADYIQPGSLGNALEAGATGVSSDASTAAERPEPTEEMVSVAEDVVSYLGGENVDQIEPGGVLEDMNGNVANITASYMPDIHNSFVASASPDGVRIETPGAAADFERAASERLLFALGKDEDALHTLLGANDGATATIVAEGYDVYDGNAWLGDAVAPGAKISGILADGSVSAIQEAGQQSDADHNNNANRVADGVNFALDQTRFGSVASPLVDGIAESYHIDTRVETTYEGQVEFGEHREGAGVRTADAVDLALMEAHGYSAEEAVAFRSDQGLSGTDIEGWFNDGYHSVEEWR